MAEGTEGNGTEGTEGTEGKGEGAKPDESALGDAGKRALDQERTARADAERAARDAKAELDKLKKTTMTDQERAVAEAREEERASVLKSANDRLLVAEIRAAAAGKLKDPGDAAALIGDTKRFIGQDGEIDTKAISSAIGELVKAKPYLSATPGNGSGEGGPRGGNASKAPTMDDFIRGAARK